MPDFFSIKSKIGGKKINWPLLCLSFALALLLWGYVTAQDNPMIEQRYDVQIDYINLADNLAVVDKPETVRIKVAATSNVLAGLSSGDFAAYVDLQGAALGQYAAKLQFDMPSGVQLSTADFSEVMLEIDRLRQKQYSVNVSYANDEPAEGYMALGESLLPGEVVLLGAEEKLSQVADVYVSVDLSGLQQNFRAELPINVVDANGNSLLSWITPQPATVDVLVPVVGSRPTKVAPVSVTLSGAPAAGYVISRIIIDPAVVTIMGAQSVIDGVDYVYTSAVNISGATSAVSQQVSLLGIDGVELDKTANYQARVIIEREAVRTIDDVAITMLNQQADYNYQLAVPTCSVTVRGPISAVNGLTNTDIEAKVDVANLGSGKHRQQIRAASSANVTLDLDDTVLVTVSKKNK